MKSNLLSKRVHRTNPKAPADKPNQNGQFCVCLQANGKYEPIPGWPDLATAQVDGAEGCLRNAFLWEKPGLHSQQLEEEGNAVGVI